MFPVLPHGIERLLRGARSAEPARQGAGVVAISPGAESEDNLSLLSVSHLKGNLNRRTRIESGSNPSGKARPGHGGGSRKRPVAADEFGPVAGYGSIRFARVEESGAAGELRVVWTGCQQRSAGVELGDH